MTSSIGWNKARDMTVKHRDAEMRAALTTKWNERAALESPERVQGELVTVRLPTLTPEQAADVHWGLSEALVDAGRIDDGRMLCFVGEAATPSPQAATAGAIEAAIDLLNQIAWNNTDRPRYVATEAVDLLRPVLAALRASTPAERVPLSDEQIEKLRDATFSINNPFCPVDSKSMRKAVRAAEHAHGIVTKEST
jgi:hypothetical protein